MPKNEENWKTIADDFYDKWDFPHCVGAIDGKHIVINKPHSSGSFYSNYKHTFSIVLMAAVDANYKFIYIDVGCNGRVSDGGVFRESSLGKAMEDKSLGVPKEEPLKGGVTDVPYVFVGD